MAADKEDPTKSLADIEKEHGITETVHDLSKRYLGLPPSQSYYKKGEIDFEETRAEFDAAVKRLRLV